MQERINRTDKRAHYAFNSLAELARYVADTAPTWESKSSRDNPASADWDLGAGYSRAWELAREGWNEGARKAQETLKQFAPSTPAPDTRTDFYGHMPHVPRYCAGAPDCMIRKDPRPASGAGKVLTLIVPVNASGSTGASHMHNFGAAVVQYVNQLEASGTRVELYGGIRSRVSGWAISHTWKIKGADQPLDLAVVAFTIGHPAMFRRLGFALRERCAARQDWGYGISEDMRPDDLLNAPAGAVVLNGMKDASSTARTPAAALAYVTKQIDRALEGQG